MYVIVILIISVACYWATVVQFFGGLAAVWGGGDRPLRPPPRGSATGSGTKNLSYEKRLEYLGLWTSEEQRNRADLLEVFKMYKGLSTIPFERLFALSTATNTRGHAAKIAKLHCHLDLRRYFFSERTVDHWNNLSQQHISCSTVNSFKNCLNNICHTKTGFFMD